MRIAHGRDWSGGMNKRLELLLQEKRKGLGSSDAPAILGVSRWKTQLHVQVEKLSGEPTQEEKDITRLGLIMEPVIMQLYADRTGVKPRRVRQVLHSKEYPFMLAHIDAKAGAMPLEIKHVLFPQPGEWGAEGSDEVREEYLIQTHHQMFVTETDCVEIPVLMFGKLRIYVAKRSERLMSHLVETEKEFWQRHIIKQEPVSPDFEHPATLPLIRKLYGVDEGKQIELGAEFLPLVGLYQEICRKNTEDKKRIDSIKAELLTIVG